MSAARIWAMATREQLHKQVDAVPEEALERAHLVIEPNGVAIDTHTNTIDDWGSLSAVTDSAAGDLMDRLADEEAATEHDPW
jgi:hypothetical protein